MPIYYDIVFIESNFGLDFNPDIAIIKPRYRSLNFWGARGDFDPLTNVYFDLSLREKVVCKPAHEQDA